MGKLAKRFAAIEEKWGEWIIDNEQARVRLRYAKPREELVAFHDDIYPQVKEFVEYIGQYPVDNLPADAKNLWWLLSSYIGIAVAVEMYGTLDAIPGGNLMIDARFLKTPTAPELLR